MKCMRALRVVQLMTAGAVLVSMSAWADGPPTQVKLEYLMTMLAPLDPSSDVNNSLSISNVRTIGSWAKGPHIRGTFLPPGRARFSPATKLNVDQQLYAWPQGSERIVGERPLMRFTGQLLNVSNWPSA